MATSDALFYFLRKPALPFAPYGREDHAVMPSAGESERHHGHPIKFGYDASSLDHVISSAVWAG